MLAVRLLPLLLVAAAAPVQAPRVATTTAGVTLASDSDTRWVTFDLTPGNQVRFQMQVDGQPATAILDTGVSVSVVSQRFATAARLAPARAPDAQASAIGGNVPVRWAATRTVAIGGLQRMGGRMASVELGAITTGGGEPVDVLVGSDLLACCAIDIDYDAQRFRILPSGRMPFAGATVPLGLSSRSGVFVSEVTIGGRRLRPMIVDTGDGAALTLSRAAWASTGVRPAGTTSAIAYGLGGPIETEVAILPTARIGAQAIGALELRIESRRGFSDLTGTAGRIGSSLLQRYRVLMDPRAGHMVLKPGKRAALPPLKSTSGLLVGHDTGRLRVLHVMRNSPAAASGWKTGDTICTVEGAAVRPAGGGSIDTGWSAGAPGRVVRLGLCDGTERSLTLRAFY